jgi:hypothetical protein
MQSSPTHESASLRAACTFTAALGGLCLISTALRPADRPRAPMTVGACSPATGRSFSHNPRALQRALSDADAGEQGSAAAAQTPSYLASTTARIPAGESAKGWQGDPARPDVGQTVLCRFAFTFCYPRKSPQASKIRRWKFQKVSRYSVWDIFGESAPRRHTARRGRSGCALGQADNRRNRLQLRLRGRSWPEPQTRL